MPSIALVTCCGAHISFVAWETLLDSVFSLLNIFFFFFLIFSVAFLNYKFNSSLSIDRVCSSSKMSLTQVGQYRQNLQPLPFSDQCHQSNNVLDAPIHPSLQKSVPSSNSASQTALRSEALRLATFQGWPLEYLSPRDLSRAGFFYRGLADQTQCAFCCITISQWEAHDDPMAEHRRHAPNCPFVLQLSVGNIPLSSNRNVPTVPVASSSRPSCVFPSLGGSGGADTCSRFQNESRPNALPERGEPFSTKFLGCYSVIQKFFY